MSAARRQDGFTLTEVLVAMLASVLGIAYRAPSAIVLAQLAGVLASELAIGGDGSADPASPHVIDREQAANSSFGRQRVPLVLSTEHRSYRAAVAADPRAGAAHLARLHEDKIAATPI